MKKISQIIFVLCFLASRALSQEKTPDGDLDRLKQAMDRCVAALSRDQVTNTLQDLFKEYWCFQDRASNDAMTLEAKVELGFKEFRLNAGAPISGQFEFLGTRRLGKSVVRFIYLCKYEHDALLIRFECYRPHERWGIRTIQFGERVNSDLPALATGAPVRDAELDRCREATDNCVSGFCQDQYTNAFAGLFKRYWYKKGEAEEAALDLESQYDGIRRATRLNHEKIIAGAYEYLGTRRLGQNVAQIAYLEKADVSTVLFLFEYYRGTQGWELHGVTMGADLQDDTPDFWKDEPTK